jgi:hypothetical protein
MANAIVQALVPNAKTVAAMQEARRGGLRRHPNAKALLKSLNADDRGPVGCVERQR